MSKAIVDVLDGYLENPEEVREWAVQSEFVRPFTGTWNGLHSTRSHPSRRELFFDIASRIPEKGRSNWEDVVSSEKFWERPSAGVFALLLDGQKDTVHFHQRTGSWSAVLYLSRKDDCVGRSGVSFYRHAATGAERFDELSNELIPKFKEDSQFDDRWELVYSVEMRFNRLVIFNGKYFHAASAGFGDNPLNGRLTQLFSMNISE